MRPRPVSCSPKPTTPPRRQRADPAGAGLPTGIVLNSARPCQSAATAPAPLITDTAHMAELRAAQAGDVGAIVAIDPSSLGRPGEILALVRERASLVAV